MTIIAPRTLTAKMELKSSVVISPRMPDLAMPALLIRMSIWNCEVWGSVKWCFTVEIRWIGPVGVDMSDLMGRHIMECLDSSSRARVVASREESSDV